MRQLFEVGEVDVEWANSYKSYFYKDDVEIIKENVEMFDLKKEKWFIRTPTPEISKLVQEWLFEQGIYWIDQPVNLIQYTDKPALGFGHMGAVSIGQAPIDYWTRNGHKEIKLTFKTIIDSVEYPETVTPEQQQLASLIAHIEQFKSEAQQLQAIINKGKV